MINTAEDHGMVGWDFSDQEHDDEDMYMGEDTPLMKACMCDDADAVETLLSNGNAEIDKTLGGRAALHIASMHGHIPIMTMLLDNGADVNKVGRIEGTRPLDYACVRRHLDAIQLLINRGAEPDIKGYVNRTALVYASIENHIDVVELLLNNSSDPDIRDRDGMHALLHASAKGHLAVVNLLLTRGASIDIMSGNGYTSLYYSSWKGHAAVVEMLLKRGAKVDARDDGGHTPLQAAAGDGHVEIVKMLLDDGADVHAEATRGTTALWEASRHDHVIVVELLLERGADPHKANKYGVITANLDAPNAAIRNRFAIAKKIRARYLLKRWRIWFIARNFWLYWYFRAVNRIYTPGMPGHAETMAALEQTQQQVHAGMTHTTVT